MDDDVFERQARQYKSASILEPQAPDVERVAHLDKLLAHRAERAPEALALIDKGFADDLRASYGPEMYLALRSQRRRVTGASFGVMVGSPRSCP